MPHNLTESSVFTGNVSVPDDADDLIALSVETPFQALANRTKYLVDLAVNKAPWPRDGTVHWARVIYCENGGQINLSPIHSMYYSLGLYSQDVNTESIIDVTGMGLSPNTWYYLYAYISGGAIAIEVSATGCSNGWNKNGDVSRRYLGVFRRGASAVVPFLTANGVTLYNRSTAADADLHVLAAGGATSWASVANLPKAVPPVSRIALLDIKTVNSGGSVTGEVRTPGAAGSWPFSFPSTASGPFGLTSQQVITNASQLIDYQVTAGAGTPTMDIYAAGFIETVY